MGKCTIVRVRLTSITFPAGMTELDNLNLENNDLTTFNPPSSRAA